MRVNFAIAKFGFMKKRYIVGVDLGGTNTKVGLIYRNTVLKKEVLSTGDFFSPASLISALTDSITRILNVCSIRKAMLAGIGVGLPGPVDFLKGIVHYFPNIEGWHEVPLRRIMQKKTGLPVWVDNDANLMCLAESRAGAAKGKKNVVGVTLGTGVGGGILINGSLYRGCAFAAGEIGHMPINESGPLCNCGGRACLERYIGNKRILEKAKECFKRDISLERLSLLAREGNLKARMIWREVAAHLGVALAQIANLLNPEIIVIGGGVAESGAFLFDNIRKVVRERSMSVQSGSLKIVKAKLGNDAGIVGAALLVKEECENT